MTDYAIIKRGKHQFFVQKGKYIDMPKLAAEKSAEIEFAEVVLTNVDGKLTIGQPLVEKAVVKARVLRHIKTEKEQGSKFKAKSRYRKQWGFRQFLTRIKVEDIAVSSK